MKKLFLPIALLLLALPALAQTTPHSVTLTWTPSVPSTAFPASDTGYNVYRSTVSGSETMISPPTANNGVSCTATGCSYVDAASATNILVEGATYFYIVRAISLSQKILSIASNETQATIPKTTTAPAAPKNLNGIANWRPESDDLTP